VKPVIFHSAAEAELEAASDYYENCRRGLGFEFEAAVQDAVRRIARLPHACPPHGKRGLRKCLVHRFPYTLYFLERDVDVWIAAVAHQRRKPDYWGERTPE
jgi:plasmid stabilization system protein ParE